MPIKLKKSLKALKRKVNFNKKECHIETKRKLDVENVVGPGKEAKEV